MIKKIWHQIWICPMEKHLILLHFHCLGWLQSWNWILILKVIKIILLFFRPKHDVRFEYILSNSVLFDLSFAAWVKFWQFQFTSCVHWVFCQIKIWPSCFLFYLYFWYYYRNSFVLEKFLMILRYFGKL